MMMKSLYLLPIRGLPNKLSTQSARNCLDTAIVSSAMAQHVMRIRMGLRRIPLIWKRTPRTRRTRENYIQWQCKSHASRLGAELSSIVFATTPVPECTQKHLLSKRGSSHCNAVRCLIRGHTDAALHHYLLCFFIRPQSQPREPWIDTTLAFATHAPLSP